MSIKGTRTEKNLLKSFAGESQARMRYTFFAEQAEKEGYQQIAAYFNETAWNEKAHAERFFSFLEGGDLEITADYPAGKVGTTAENLKEAAAGENHEHTNLYPSFAEIAEKEGFKDVAIAFRVIANVEKQHEARYLKLLDNIKRDEVFNKDTKTPWKCWVCGHVHEGERAPKKCPVCFAPRSQFAIKEQNY